MDDPSGHLDLYAYVVVEDNPEQMRCVHLACHERAEWTLDAEGARACEWWLTVAATNGGIQRLNVVDRLWYACQKAMVRSNTNVWPVVLSTRAGHDCHTEEGDLARNPCLSLVLVQQEDHDCNREVPPLYIRTTGDPLWNRIRPAARPPASSTFRPYLNLKVGGSNNRALRLGLLSRGGTKTEVVEKLVPAEIQVNRKNLKRLMDIPTDVHCVLRVVDFSPQWNGGWRIYTAWYPGGSLAAAMFNASDSPPLSRVDCAQVLADAWAGMYYLHSELNIIHNDLHPYNIFLERRGPDGQLRGLMSGAVPMGTPSPATPRVQGTSTTC
jgi:hypothetical protein